MVSGQCLNYEKSKVAFSPNISIEIREVIKRSMGIEVVSCHEKYFGLLMIMSKNKKNVFDEIKEKVAKKVGGWQEQFFWWVGKRC